LTYPKTQAVKMRDEVICDLLERLCRVRPLDDEETALLAKTVLRLGIRQGHWRWTRNEDKAVQRLIARRMISGPSQPFIYNDEVRLLAARLGRSYMAVHRRMERLRRRRGIPPLKLFKREAYAVPLQCGAWTRTGNPMTP